MLGSEHREKYPRDFLFSGFYSAVAKGLGSWVQHPGVYQKKVYNQGREV